MKHRRDQGRLNRRLPKFARPLRFEPLEVRHMLAATLVSDIVVGSGDSNPRDLTAVGSTIYFSASDATGNTNRELWRSSGGAATLVGDLNSTGGSNPHYLTSAQGLLYFVASDGTGLQLFSTGGGTPTKIAINTAGSSDPQHLTQVGSALYFSAVTPANGRELFVIPSAGSQPQVLDVASGGASSSPSDLANFNGTLYFAADDGIRGRELWKSNGSQVGTVIVRDIVAGGSSSPSGMKQVGNRLFFAASDGGPAFNELWISDGTCAGTRLLADLNTSVANNGGSSDPERFYNFNGNAVFSAIDPIAQREPWVSDGTGVGTSLVFDGGTFFDIATPNTFTTYYYYGYYGYGGYTAYGGSSNPNEFIEANGILYFSADQNGNVGTGAQRRKLYQLSQGSNLATVVRNLSGAGADDNPHDLFNAQGTLYFSANNGTNGQELFRTNGTSVGTVIDTDINPGTGSSDPAYMAQLNGYLYFAATGANGRELYKTLIVGPNTAPILNPALTPTLTAQDEDNFNATGTAINTLIASAGANYITDPDVGAVQGIALTGVNAASGTWQYTTDGGSSWNNINAATLNATNALQLASNSLNRLRFVPTANFSGTISSAITFRAWDQYRGANGTFTSTTLNGGFTAFSSATDTANLVVQDVPDTPSISNATTNEDTQSTSGLVVIRNGVDSTLVDTVRITAITGGNLFLNNGTTAVLVNSTVSYAVASQGFRFTPTPANSFGVARGSVSVQVVNSTANPAVSPSGIVTATIDVLPVADRPSVTNTTTVEDIASSTGLVVTLNAVDGPEIGFFRISNITNGSVFVSGGGQIFNNQYISVAQGNAGLVFLGSQDFNGTASFDIQGSVDNIGTGLGVATTAQVVITPFNDAPQGTAPALQTTLQGNAFPFVGNAFQISDVDGGGGTEQITLSIGTGSWQIDTTGLASATGVGTPTLTISGSLPILNSALNSLQYVPPTLTFTGTTLGTMTLNDLGNIGPNGALTTVVPLGISVLPANELPIQTLPGTQFFNEDTPLTFGGVGPVISITDADAGTASIRTDLLATHGTLSIGTLGAATIGSATPTFIRLLGSQTAITNALASLVFTPDPDYYGTASLSVTTDDLGNSGFPLYGPTGVSTGLVPLTIAPVNDAPSASVPATITTNQTVPFGFTTPSTFLSVSDIDSVGNAEQVVVRVTNGTLQLAQPVVGNGTNTLTLNYPIATINSYLQTLVYTPNITFSGTENLVTTINDLGNFGSGGSISRSFSSLINVVNINHPPTITPPATQIFNEGTVLTLSSVNGNRIDIFDIDPSSTGATAVMTVSATNGILNIPDPSLPAALNNRSSITLTNSIVNFQTFLNGMTYTPNKYFSGAASISIAVNDMDTLGIGGPKSTTANVVLSVSPVNDAPIVTTPVRMDTGVNVPVTFSTALNSRISVTDPDLGTGLMVVNLTATGGTLQLGSTIGLQGLTGNGSSSLAFSANSTLMNNALEGLVFSPTLTPVGQTAATATILLSANDQGQSGSGGAKTSLSNITVYVRPTISFDPSNPRTVYVTGTNNDDVLSAQFSSPTAYVIYANGTVYSDVTSVHNQIQFLGLAGNDQLNVIASSLADSAQLPPKTLALTSSNFSQTSGVGYAVYSSSTETVNLYGSTSGGVPNDTVLFYDTAGDDLFTAQPTTALMNGTGYMSQVSNFRNVYGFASTGDDRAIFVNSPGNDTFTAAQTFAIMSGTNYFNQSIGFKQNYAFGGGGFDTAQLLDSPGNDSFFGLPTYSIFSNGAFFNQATFFNQVYAYSNTGAVDSGGSDNATLYDSSGNDTFNAFPTYSTMQSNGAYLNYVVNFANVGAFSTIGTDVANLFDSYYTDVYIASPTNANMFRNNGAGPFNSATGVGSYNNQAINFKRTNAYSSKGNDSAYLFDSAGVDSFTGQDGAGTLSGANFANAAYGFLLTQAFSSNGGIDTAVFSDSSANDRLTAAGSSVLFNYSFYTSQIAGFKRVTANSSSGGHDVKQVQAIDYTLTTNGVWYSS